MSNILTHVLNTITNGVTTFEAYTFNSMTRFQGKYLGASDAGLFWLDDPASVEAVDGTLTTGELDFRSEFLKRVSDFYLGMHSTEVITLTVTTDKGQTASYTIDPRDVDTLNPRRSIIGKGLRGRYWTFELVCSATFEYDTMNIAVVAVDRRV